MRLPNVRGFHFLPKKPHKILETKGVSMTTPTKEQIEGQQFGRIKVLSFHHKDGNKYFYLCKCSCGNEKVIERISSIFFSLLIILMIFVVFNDITLLIKK